MPLKKERALLIINPKAGTQGARRNFYSIVAGLSKKYTLTTHITETFDDARMAASQAEDFSTVICCGGDGTVSQIVDGYPLSKKKPSIGYVPCGTANDFAATMKYSRNIARAVSDVCNGRVTPHDLGCFNGRRFVYVASFGAFTKASYNTPQNVKNFFGPLAYLVSGAMDLASIKNEQVKIVCDGTEYSFDDACFLAVLNTHSVGGVLKIDPAVTDLADGKHELLLIRKPKTLQRLSELVASLSQSRFSDPGILLIKGSEFEITTKNRVAWTLDGEDSGEFYTVKIKNLYQAINFITPPETKKRRVTVRNSTIALSLPSNSRKQ